MKEIKSDIARLAALTDSLTAQSSELERDVVLDLLRKIYVEVKFGAQSATAVRSTATVDEHQFVSESEPVCKEPSAASAPQPLCEPEHVVIPIVKAEPVTKPEPTTQSTEAVSEPQTVAEPETAVTPTPVSVSEPVVKQVVEPQQRVEVSPRPKISREVIASLYGEPTPVATPKAEPATTVQPKPQSEVQGQTKTVLGDVINAGTQRLGDTLGDGRRDIASHIAASGTHDLLHSIGINDKFLIMRDLFKGNSSEYERVIMELDAQPTFDDALLYISGFDWNADSDGARLLMSILKRKFE